nr:xylulose kinase-1 [Tanacetum cinerariifolium]
MVAYLKKFDASEGFTEIIDFLNGSYIKYALMVNPNIYVSCIKQFWTTVAIKQVNGVTRLQALVDKKKVVVTEAAIRDVLRLDDVEGVDCLPNEEIFMELVRMRYEKPSTKLTFYKAFFSSQWKFLIHTILQSMSAKQTLWNEFSSSMASAVICLSTGDLSTHTTKYTSPVLTHKVFANIRRVGKGFSRVETPLFEGMLVGQEIEEEGDADEHVKDVTAGDDVRRDDSAAHREVPTVTQEPSIPSPTPPTLPPQPPQDLPSTSQVQKTLPQSPYVQTQPQPQPQPQQAANFPMSLLQDALDACAAFTKRVEHLEYDKRVDTFDDTVMDDESNQGRMIVEMDKDDVVVLMDEKEEDKKVEEAKEDETEPTKVQEVVDVVTTAKLITEVVTATSETVTAASVIIPMAEPQVPAATLTATPSRKRKGVVIRDPEKESTTSTIIPETKSKDKDKEILAEEPKPLKKKQQIEMVEEYARNLHAELNKDIDWDIAIDHVKLKAKEDPAIKELMEKEENRALQTINETPAEKAAKRRKLNEEVEDLKRHLEIMPDEDDDVYTEATSLARKVPVVDYEIIEINNKPYYKIIRADGTRQLYISFLTLLKNVDREDLKAL